MLFKDFCIEEIKRIIQQIFSNLNGYNIEVYGSYATGLMIEASDIDIKIRLNNGIDLENIFTSLCNKLKEENKFDEINPIRTASVPVIKLLLNPIKFIKGKEELENKFKQFKEMSIYKHYLFDIKELINIKIDVTFILPNYINQIKPNDNVINNDNEKLTNNEISSVSYVKEQIIKYPEVKFILRVLKRYFYIKKMNTSFLGGISSYNLFLLLLSYAIFNRNNNSKNEENKKEMNLGKFFYEFLNFFSRFNFKDCIIDIGSKLNKGECPYSVLDISDDKYKNLGYGKSLVIIDPLSGVNASKSSYKIDEISNTFYNAFDYFVNEINEYERGGYKNQKYNKNNNENMVMGLNNQNKNNDSNGGGNIIEKFLLK